MLVPRVTGQGTNRCHGVEPYDQEDLAIETCKFVSTPPSGNEACARGWLLTDDTAVVSQVPVQDGQADVEQDAMGALVQQKPAEHLQAVRVDIELVEMVEARVSAYFQFLESWSEAAVCHSTFTSMLCATPPGRTNLQDRREDARPRP